MNGIHDMGGIDSFGPVIPEENEPVFHADWERRMFAVAHAITFTVPFGDDHLRREIERLSPKVYLSASYYELWFRSVKAILEEKGVLREGDLDNYNAGPSQPLHADALLPADVEETIAGGASTRKDVAEVPQVLQVGDTIRVKNNHPLHHTRAPRYCRDKLGIVVHDHGIFVFPDTNSQDIGERPQHCYAVEFTGEALWGDDAEPGTSMIVDLLETYMDRV